MLSGQLDAIAALAVIFLPKEDGVNDGPRHAPRRAVLKPPRSRRDRLVGHSEAFAFSPNQGVERLIDRNEKLFHAWYPLENGEKAL